MTDLIMIFKDTAKLCRSNEVLKNSIQNTIQKQYTLKETSPVKNRNSKKYDNPFELKVSGKRSFEAAKEYPDKKVCVLNFASATHVGGGVVTGASAQEECLCRCSTLYFAIEEEEKNFHAPHRKLLWGNQMDARYNHDCIYSPDITVFKSDTAAPQLLPENQWYHVDVITCAAPNLNRFYGSSILSNQEIKKLHIARAKRILDIARSEGEEVLILGAFGCGAFRNPPEIVSQAWAEALQEYLYDFEKIEFAVYCKPNRPSDNYTAFEKTLKKSFDIK